MYAHIDAEGVAAPRLELRHMVAADEVDEGGTGDARELPRDRGAQGDRGKKHDGVEQAVGEDARHRGGLRL